MQENIAPCPWCKQTPTHRQYTVSQSVDSIGNRFDRCLELPEESVECCNVKCSCRPRIYRTNVSDAIKLWNMCQTNEISLR